MIKRLNNGNTLIISHIADIDGMGGIILGSLAFKNMDYFLIEFHELDEVIDCLLENDLYKKYDRIFITDVSIRQASISKIEKSDLKNKLLIFDHHQTETETNKYDWATVISEVNGFKPSGTSLFYDYLIEHFSNSVLESQATKEFVEAIRSYDTWTWKKDGNLKGEILTNIFIKMGIENFISFYSRKLSDVQNSFDFTEEESKMSDDLEREIKDYITWCDENLYRIKLDGYNVGLSISTKFRSDVGNTLSQKYKNELDYILIVNLERESFSARTVNDINLPEICKQYGGGGNGMAGGFPMTLENLKLVEDAIKKTEKDFAFDKLKK